MKKIEKGTGYFFKMDYPYLATPVLIEKIHENIVYKQVGLMNQAPTNTRLLRHCIPRNDNVGLMNQAPAYLIVIR